MALKDIEARREYNREYQRKWARENREKRREYEKTWRLRNPEKHKQKARRQALKRKYDITIEDYTAMFEAQNGVCAICKRPQRATRSAHLAVDHNHKTGKIRGLLCDWCNTGLGFLESPLRPVFDTYLQEAG